MKERQNFSGYPEPFARKVEAVAALSPYYLLFGKQSDRSGVYTRFWVEARLPDSLSFSCLDTIGARILRTSLDLTTNIEYEALGKMPSNYHLAEIRVMNKLKAEVDKLRECCYYQQRGLSSCDAPCLTPDETKKLLEQLGFTAIPIKILGPAQARGADGQRPVYDRVTDCAELDIEMDGVEYHDFAGTINNIMSVYQDSTVRAEILDEECLCLGGVKYIYDLRYQKTELIIYFWTSPIQSEEYMYFIYKSPDNLGTLPFKGHVVKDVVEETKHVNMTSVLDGVSTIYQKNGFSLQSIDQNDPGVLSFEDLYTKLRDNGSFKADTDPAGHTFSISSNQISSKDNYLKYQHIVIKYSDYINSSQHRNYIVSVHTAHELMHDILDKCIAIIKMEIKMSNIGPYGDYKDGTHYIENRNLMFPSNGLDLKHPIALTQTEKTMISNLGGPWPRLFVTGHFYPKNNNPYITSNWELITPTHKIIISLFQTITESKRIYGTNSNEYKCIKSLLKNKFPKINTASYANY